MSDNGNTPTEVIENAAEHPDVDLTEDAAQPKLAVSKAVTIMLMADGNITLEPIGFSNLELPSLFRVAAKMVEKQMGIE